MKFILLISLPFILVSCASVERSTLIGALIGGTGGGVAGSLVTSGHQREGGAIVGTFIGASLGGVIGYLAFKSKDQKHIESGTSNSSLDPKTPLLTSPKVRRVWVPAKIEGEKYIDGHFMFVIEKTSGWSN